MSASQRRKGAQWERDLAARWRDAGIYPNAQRGTGQARSGADVPDVDGTPWWVECKVGKRPNLLAALKQAEAATLVAREHGRGKRPAVVVAKWDGQRPVVAMRLETFEALLRVMEHTIRKDAADALRPRKGDG